MRASGILLHISSLPSGQGIGTFGRAAFAFVDFLARAGQTYWQILPIGPTGYGDSPYQSFSTFAGNPYFIDLELLEQDGLLMREDYATVDWGENPERVDYGKIYEGRLPVLKKAFERGRASGGDALAAFRAEQARWLEDYALFMALKDHFGGKAWGDWDDAVRLRKPEALSELRRVLRGEVEFWVYVQFLFHRQWTALKAYAAEKKVRIIGDLPIYVAMDSADVWSNPELFQLDQDLRPTFVAGVPPDYFAPEGQLWGNPLYDWKQHKKTGYAWWIERVRAATTTYDMVRIDHFRGFAGYYAIPAADKNAVNGCWKTGPGMRLFEAVQKALGHPEIIAEDLGALTDDVCDLLERSGFPGMKVLQFAFDSNWDNDYLPHNHIKNCVVYTGTHDNDTLMSWWHTAISDEERRHAFDYLRLSEEEGINWGLLRAAWSSVACLAVAPIQDFLALGGGARMNHPSTLGGNWQFRVAERDISNDLADRIERLSGLYQRSSKK